MSNKTEMPKTYATTQRTSKKLKAQIALSNLTMLVAAPVGVVDYVKGQGQPSGVIALCVFLFAIGFMWRSVVSLLIWWNHE